MTSAPDSSGFEVRRIWSDERARAALFQILVVLGLALFIAFIVSNTIANLQTRGLKPGFGFLTDTAFFDINQNLIEYSSTSTFGRALIVGLLNTLLVSALGIIAATVIGFTAGVLRLSHNWLISHYRSQLPRTPRRHDKCQGAMSNARAPCPMIGRLRSPAARSIYPAKKDRPPNSVRAKIARTHPPIQLRRVDPQGNNDRNVYPFSRLGKLQFGIRRGGIIPIEDFGNGALHLQSRLISSHEWDYAHNEQYLFFWEKALRSCLRGSAADRLICDRWICNGRQPNTDRRDRTILPGRRNCGEYLWPPGRQRREICRSPAERMWCDNDYRNACAAIHVRSFARGQTCGRVHARGLASGTGEERSRE